MIKVLADTASDLSPEAAAKSGISLVPAYIHFEGRKYLSTEISTMDILNLVEQTRTLPITSAPTREDWANAYETALHTADEVVSVHMASGLSRSFEAASQAARLFGGRVHPVDSQIGTYGLALQALRAADMADHSVSAPSIVEDLRQVQHKQSVYFMAGTLDYLKMSGRVSGVSAFLGNLFGIKPLMKYEGGQIIAAGRARGTSNGLTELTKAVLNFASHNPGTLRVAYLYSPGGEADVASLRAQMASWGYKDGGTHMIGSTMTSVTGPYGVGIVAELVRPLPKGLTPGHGRGRHEPLGL